VLPPFPDIYLAAALLDGFVLNDLKLVHHTAGDLRLPTGRLSACDPFTTEGRECFSLAFPHGTFPVVLVIAETSTDQRVAFAIVQFSVDAPARWEMLTTGNQDAATLKEGMIFGYPVDSGTGCFADFSILRQLADALAKDSTYFDKLNTEMEKSYRHTWSWLNTKVGDGNLVAFSSGYGDGVYGTYVGYNKQEEICCALSDFGVLPAESFDTAPRQVLPDNPPKRGLGALWDSLRGRK
jgi:hypothetical protein